AVPSTGGEGAVLPPQCETSAAANTRTAPRRHAVRDISRMTPLTISCVLMRNVSIAVLLSIAMLATVHADDWPHWRGPSASGVSREQGLPSRWSDTENIAWKASIRGLGISSPIVSGDLVFVTSQAGSGVVRPG